MSVTQATWWTSWSIQVSAWSSSAPFLFLLFYYLWLGFSIKKGSCTAVELVEWPKRTPHFQTKPRHVWLVWVFPGCSLLLATPLLPRTSRSGSVKVSFYYNSYCTLCFFSDLCFLFIQPTLGVNKSSSALLYVILSPVGPYFKTGTFSPVALLADPSFVRAWPGGCGDCKLGG